MKCPFPISIRAPSVAYTTRHIAVPCGKCGICLQNEVTMWKIRLTEEARNKIANSFLTLTYNDENLPKTGVDKTHIQDFIRALRRQFKLRYYIISEYGPTTNRPHYHGILFGIDQNEISANKLEVEVWKKGFVTLESITPTRVNYVAEYHVLKNRCPDGANPNFKLMSLKPAIGANYLDREKNFHVTENQLYYRNKNYKLQLPRYYKERLYPKSELRRASINRQKQVDINELRQAQNDPKYFEIRAVNTQEKIRQIIDRRIKKGKI